jgi:metal-responsive CopG/Arc/MetJ family transcriptional regulator
MENVTTISVSLPKTIVSEIDSNRGDVSRSKFVLRLIESKFQIKRGEEKNNYATI